MWRVYIIYHSDTGRTHALAKMIAEGVRKVQGVDVKIAAADELDLGEAARADGFAIGSPDYFNYVAGDIKTLFDSILYDERFKGKPYVSFGTRRVGGNVLGVIDSLAKPCGLKQAAAGVLTQGHPDDEGRHHAHLAGRALAKAVKD